MHSTLVRIPPDVLAVIDGVCKAAGPIAATRGHALRLLILCAPGTPEEVIDKAIQQMRDNAAKGGT